MNPARCDICACTGNAAPIDRAALPDAAPWVKLICQTCAARFGRIAAYNAAHRPHRPASHNTAHRAEKGCRS